MTINDRKLTHTTQNLLQTIAKEIWRVERFNVVVELCGCDHHVCIFFPTDDVSI
jgi:hypothetical protein